MSSKAHPSDAIDPLDRMIARLYRSGLQVAAPQFRSWALAQLAQVLPCDGVLWGRGVLAEMRFHTVTVHGLPAAFPPPLESTSASNPILPHLLTTLDTPIAIRDVCPDKTFFSSALYRSTFHTFGIISTLSTAHKTE